MTQKEAEDILSAAGWRIYSQQSMTNKWIVTRGGTAYEVDIWRGSVGFSSSQNKVSMGSLPPELLLPKEIADVLRHCS